jgi:RNAse (barnase) inhibitor barstar
MEEQAGFWERHLGRGSDFPVHLVDDTPQVIDGIMEFVEDNSFKLFELNLSNLRSREELWSKIAQEMSFPDYFGQNWAALLDSMSAISWWEDAPGYVVLIRGSDAFLQASAEDFQIFFEVVANTIDTIRRSPDLFPPDVLSKDPFEPTPYHVFVVGNAPRFEIETAVGVTRVCDHRQHRLQTVGQP